MARDVIDSLQEEGFQYLVAPYEADAQLAFLESQGIITAAISEDSDLIAFGCKKVLFKMNQCGEGVVFDRARIHRAKAVDIGGWSDAQIRRMCILSGCDYAASAPGIGLRKAHRYVARSTDIQMAVRLMRADGVPVADGYEDDVERAELTFLYQRVYDPRTTMLDFVTPLAGGVRAESMPFIGDALDPRVAQSVAEAEIDPFTFEPFRKPSAELEEAEGVKAEAAAAADDVKEEGQRAAAGAATRPQPGPATPVRRTLVSLWRKKSAFATILAKPSAPDAQQASLTV
ncbi:Rad2 nuclease, partial [Coemansia nantahalensis]